jgi:hypothetical protein
VILATYFKDPQDPKWNDHAAVADLHDDDENLAPDTRCGDSHAMFGYSIEESIIVLLRQFANDRARRQARIIIPALTRSRMTGLLCRGNGVSRFPYSTCR